MTKAKSKFAKTLLALLVTLALAIAMLGGGLATLGASAVEGDGTEEPPAAPTCELKVGDKNTTNPFVTAEGFGSKIRDGYTIAKTTMDGFDANYDIHMLPNTQLVVTTFYGNQNISYFEYNSTNGNNFGNHENGSAATITKGEAIDGTFTITSGAATGSATCKVSPKSSGVEGAANKKFRFKIYVEELSEEDYSNFSLQPLAVNFVGGNTLYIDTKIATGNSTIVNNVQATAQDKLLFLQKIKFYIPGVSSDKNDLLYFNNFKSGFSMDVNIHPDVNVT